MRLSRFSPMIVITFLSYALAYAQNSQSLGDVARQTRQPKQAQSTGGSSSKDSQSGETKSKPHVITNDEIPEHPQTEIPKTALSSTASQNYKGGKVPAEIWKSQIQNQKATIAGLQRNIDSLEKSVHFAGGNYDYHVAYNERQRQKLEQVERLKSQLAEQQKLLEQMQEMARRQGYGSSVYDP